MSISRVNSIKLMFVEFKEFVVREATLHPVKAVAMLIFPLYGLMALCVWGMRKATLEKKTVTEQKTNSTGISTINNQKPTQPTLIEDTTLVDQKKEVTESWSSAYRIGAVAIAIIGTISAVYYFSSGDASVITDVPLINGTVSTALALYNQIPGSTLLQCPAVYPSVSNAMELYNSIPGTTLLQCPAVYPSASNAMELYNSIPGTTLLQCPAVYPSASNAVELYNSIPGTTLLQCPAPIYPTASNAVALYNQISGSTLLQSSAGYCKDIPAHISPNSSRGLIGNIVKTIINSASGMAVLLPKVSHSGMAVPLPKVRNGRKRQARKHNWAMIGVIAGTVFGTAANIWANWSLVAKGSFICEPMRTFSPLKLMNYFRQVEIKNAGIITPLIPGMVTWISSKTPGAASYIKKETAKTAVMTGIAFFTNLVCSQLSGSFDPSGHMMLKACVLPGLISAQKQAKTTTSKVVLYSFTALSMITDSVFMANTAGCFHWPIEIIAGGVSALGAYALADRIVEKICQLPVQQEQPLQQI